MEQGMPAVKKDTVVFSVRIDPKVVEALKAAAERDDRSMNWLINSILSDWAARQRKRPKP
jgi:predicted HicB family RNase H-like nuclease